MSENKIKELYDADLIRFEPLERFSEDVRIEVYAPEVLKDIISIYVLKQNYTLYGNDACITELARVLKENPEYIKKGGV